MQGGIKCHGLDVRANASKYKCTSASWEIYAVNDNGMPV